MVVYWEKGSSCPVPAHQTLSSPQTPKFSVVLHVHASHIITRIYNGTSDIDFQYCLNQILVYYASIGREHMGPYCKFFNSTVVSPRERCNASASDWLKCCGT